MHEKANVTRDACAPSLTTHIFYWNSCCAGCNLSLSDSIPEAIRQGGGLPDPYSPNPFLKSLHSICEGEVAPKAAKGAKKAKLKEDANSKKGVCDHLHRWCGTAVTMRFFYPVLQQSAFPTASVMHLWAQGMHALSPHQCHSARSLLLPLAIQAIQYSVFPILINRPHLCPCRQRGRCL